MVQPSQQWILNPGPLQEALSPGRPYSEHASASAPNHESAKATLARCRVGLVHSTVVLSSSSSSQTTASGCQSTDLTKQHAAAHAHALLSHLDPEASQRATVDDDVFHRLLGLGEPFHLCKVALLVNLRLASHVMYMQAIGLHKAASAPWHFIGTLLDGVKGVA